MACELTASAAEVRDSAKFLINRHDNVKIDCYKDKMIH